MDAVVMKCVVGVLESGMWEIPDRVGSDCWPAWSKLVADRWFISSPAKDF